MSTLTGDFIQDILEKSGKTLVDDEILSEVERLINEEMNENRQTLKNNIQDKHDKDVNLTGTTTVKTGVTEEIILEALKKLDKKEIDDEVVAEVEKMVQADRSAKRQVLRKIIEDN